MRLGGLIIAIVVAALAAVVALRMQADAPPPVQQAAAPVAATPQMKTVNIYVASQPIPIGTTVTQQMVAIQPWPEHLLLDGFVKADGGAEAVVGTVARSPFQQQEPILKSKLANPNDPNFMAGSLPKGMRVITIVTNETEGLAGFVFPGDRVDVLLTHNIERTKIVKTSSAKTDPRGVTSQETAVNETPVQEPVTETLINNVMVLAVDQRSSSAGAVDKEGKLMIPRSVSLMVTPQDAQRIRLGQSMGTITLSLRSLEDRESADPATLTQSSDVSQYREKAAEMGAGSADVKVYEGAKRVEQ